MVVGGIRLSLPIDPWLDRFAFISLYFLSVAVVNSREASSLLFRDSTYLSRSLTCFFIFVCRPDSPSSYLVSLDAVLSRCLVRA